MNLISRRPDASRLWAALFVAVLYFAFVMVANAAPHHQHKSHHRHSVPDANGNSAQVIGSRPSGCPSAYCGCALARFLHIHDARLNLAWNWAKLFPRTSAHPGAAAVRHGHVMLLENHVAGSVWIVRDYNSTRRLSWLHERDVRGFVFVDPGSRSASLF